MRVEDFDLWMLLLELLVIYDAADYFENDRAKQNEIYTEPISQP